MGSYSTALTDSHGLYQVLIVLLFGLLGVMGPLKSLAKLNITISSYTTQLKVIGRQVSLVFQIFWNLTHIYLKLIQFNFGPPRRPQIQLPRGAE